MTPYLEDSDFRLFHGNVRDVLPTLEAGSVDCVITSPPYFGLRDYDTGTWEGGDPDCEHKVREQQRAESSTLGGGKGTTGHAKEGFREHCPRCGAVRTDQQIGMEATPDEFVASLVEVFQEIRRVLADHGTVWLNLGDSYVSTAPGTMNAPQPKGSRTSPEQWATYRPKVEGLKPKDLMLMPARVALALQADGWWVRSDVAWVKPNPMPESCTDRPTGTYEHVFLLTKQSSYYFDQEASREPFSTKHAPGSKVNETSHYGAANGGNSGLTKQLADVKKRLQGERLAGQETLDGTPGEAPRGPDGRRVTAVKGGEGSLQHRDGERWPSEGRNMRNVWEIATESFDGAHFAVFPQELVRRALVAGCPEWVCATCGAPRERLVEVSPSSEGRENWDGQDASRNRSRKGGFDDRSASTSGWSDCGHGNYRRGVVLDPFMGSGTTALVARRHARHVVGVELSAAYCELIAERTQQLSLVAALDG